MDRVDRLRWLDTRRCSVHRAKERFPSPACRRVVGAGRNRGAKRRGVWFVHPGPGLAVLFVIRLAGWSGESSESNRQQDDPCVGSGRCYEDSFPERPEPESPGATRTANLWLDYAGRHRNKGPREGGKIGRGG